MPIFRGINDAILALITAVVVLGGTLATLVGRQVGYGASIAFIIVVGTAALGALAAMYYLKKLEVTHGTDEETRLRSGVRKKRA